MAERILVHRSNREGRPLHTPVLFLVFNRPHTTRRVFAAIRAARPPRLYVAADGPRPEHRGEAERCAEVRAMAIAVDWPCEVRTLLRDEHLGCKLGVSRAVDWFFAQEEEGIILEDDVLPRPGFFPYCEELLARYRDDAQVAMISGCNLLGSNFSPPASYFFSRYMHVWGWASWRRAWSKFDVGMADWPSPAARKSLGVAVGGRPGPRRHWRSIFDDVQSGKIDSWAYAWMYAGWMNDMVSVIPAISLVDNIGFGPDATHTRGLAPSALRHAPMLPLAFPLDHPSRDNVAEADPLIERFAMGISLMTRVKSGIRSSRLARKVVTTYRAMSWRT